MNNDDHETIMNELAEIKDALLGTYDKKGIISRIANLEKYVAIVGGLAATAITGVIGRLIVLMIG